MAQDHVLKVPVSEEMLARIKAQAERIGISMADVAKIAIDLNVPTLPKAEANEPASIPEEVSP